MKSYKLPAEVEGLTEQIGAFIEYWGFKKIHGQIWTHIWLAKTPIDATTLVKRLQVSKALVSLAIKDLLKYEVIRVAGQGNRRKILLEANTDVHAVITNVLMNRETKMLESIMTHFQKTKDLHPDIHSELNLDLAKLESMNVMIQLAQFSLAAIIETHLASEK